MIALALLLSAVPSQTLPPDRTVAATALRAAVGAIDQRKLTVFCAINSLYRVDEPCDAPEAAVRALNIGKLTYFGVSPCTIGPNRITRKPIWASKCVVFLFDRGLGDGGVTCLELSARSATVRDASDIREIRIMQWIGPH